MLKIKDDVDLEELEKFGFKRNGNYYQKIISNSCCHLIEVGINDRVPFESTKEIGYWSAKFGDDEFFRRNIKDLIQAGLVEKVDDK